LVRRLGVAGERIEPAGGVLQGFGRDVGVALNHRTGLPASQPLFMTPACAAG